MPHSLVLNLLPQSSIPPGFLTGRHLHSLFLNLVSSVNQSLGDELHKNQANKAFALSPLQVSGRQPAGNRKAPAQASIRYQYHRAIPPETPCWWRIALLDDALFSQLQQLWLDLNPHKAWHLGPADLQITSILGTAQSTQPWANFCNYAQLYEQASATDRKLTLQFCTPTAFRQRQYDTTFPTGELVFGSLLRRWNQHSSIELSKDILDAIFPGAYELKTELIRDPRSQFERTGAKVDPRSQFVGCVGQVTFQILGKVAPQTVKQINALADYALYAGVGRKTTMGMGMVRRLSCKT
ncbi:MAG: CRISPR-associated endoribonuclease Cas6 [Leptolyngbya sp. SIO4C1]|nr:CRISPR-associated endoribonuclease Cas6 [Leptolyngbya sp. SIO4C1]